MLNIREKLDTQSINKPSDDKEEEDEDTAWIEEIKVSYKGNVFKF